MVSFYIYDVIFLVAFTLFVIIFLYNRRKKLKREGPIYLYRTKIGLKIIDYFGEKHKKFIGYLEYVIIACGYLLMVAAIASLVYLAYVFFKSPEILKAAKIPPVAPLIPYIGEIFNASYLPPFYFTYWIVVLAVTAIFHEFFHGILARKNNVKIKSTGFAFLGPFLGAFVEQDEKQMNRIKTRNQISILAGGSFANLLITIFFFIIIVVFSTLAFAPSGAIFSYYPNAIINVSDISYASNSTFSINFDGGLNLTEITAGNKTYFAQTSLLENRSISQMIVFEDSPALKAGILGTITEFNGARIGTQQDLSNELAKDTPGQNVLIKFILPNGTSKETSIVLASRPDNNSRAYLGVGNVQYSTSGIFGKLREGISFFRDPYTRYSPKVAPDLTVFIYNLLWWMILINISVALFNMLPVGIFDGGKVFYLTILKLTKSKKIAQRAYSVMTYLFIAFFVAITLLWIVQYFF